jgi:hypothetical protein
MLLSTSVLDLYVRKPLPHNSSRSLPRFVSLSYLPYLYRHGFVSCSLLPGYCVANCAMANIVQCLLLSRPRPPRFEKSFNITNTSTFLEPTVKRISTRPLADNNILDCVRRSHSDMPTELRGAKLPRNKTNKAMHAQGPRWTNHEADCRTVKPSRFMKMYGGYSADRAALIGPRRL